MNDTMMTLPTEDELESEFEPAPEGELFSIYRTVTPAVSEEELSGF